MTNRLKRWIQIGMLAAGLFGSAYTTKADEQQNTREDSYISQNDNMVPKSRESRIIYSTKKDRNEEHSYSAPKFHELSSRSEPKKSVKVKNNHKNDEIEQTSYKSPSFEELSSRKQIKRNAIPSTKKNRNSVPANEYSENKNREERPEAIRAERVSDEEFESQIQYASDKTDKYEKAISLDRFETQKIYTEKETEEVLGQEKNISKKNLKRF